MRKEERNVASACPGYGRVKILKLCPSDGAAVQRQASGRTRMLNLSPNWRWMRDIRIWKWPHLKGKEISESSGCASWRNWTSSIPESGKKWPWNCKFSSKYLKLIHGGLEGGAGKYSNLRKARKMPWATTVPFVCSRFAKRNSWQRILHAFLNNWFSRQRRGIQSYSAGL